MPSLYLLITGFGIPHWEHKIQILENNLKQVFLYPWTTVKVTICQYSPYDTYQIPKDLIDKYNIQIIYEPGIVGEFMYNYANESYIKSYDYILTLLDDVELQQFNWEKALEYLKEFNLDILSPSLSIDSKYQYQYMRQEPHNSYSLKITTCCEFFCLLSKTEKFKKYHNHLDLKNPWMWGIDLILRKYANIKIGIANNIVMKHWYKNESYSSILANPVEGFKYCMEKYNENADNLANQIPVVYYILDPFC